MRSGRFVPIVSLVVVVALVASCGGSGKAGSDAGKGGSGTSTGPAVTTTTLAGDTDAWKKWAEENKDVVQSFTDFNPEPTTFTVESCTFLVTLTDTAAPHGPMPDKGFEAIWRAALDEVKASGQYCVFSLTALQSGTSLPPDAKPYGPRVVAALATVTKVIARVRVRIDPSLATTTTTTVPDTTPVVLNATYEKNGTGNFTSPDFTTPAEWGMRYAFDCSPLKHPGDFTVTATSDGKATALVKVTGADGSDIAYAHDRAGTTHLVITTDCNWTVRVTPS